MPLPFEYVLEIIHKPMRHIGFSCSGLALLSLRDSDAHKNLPFQKVIKIP